MLLLQNKNWRKSVYFIESMPAVMEEPSLSDVEKGHAVEFDVLSSSARDNSSPITLAEKLVQEQQRSMYR